jgi:hypothetical protein
MAVHYRDAAGGPVIVPVDAAIAHPRFRADAIQARVQSIDIALIRAARPLDPRFAAAAIGDGEPPAVGAPAIVSGYGAVREGDWSSGGTLRSVTLAVREPASTVLIWAADPGGRGDRAKAGKGKLKQIYTVILAPPRRPRRERGGDLVQRLRVLDRRRGRPVVLVGDFLHRPAQDLA